VGNTSTIDNFRVNVLFIENQTRNSRKYLWLPQLGCYGYQNLTQLKHVLIFHGGGVGGGSLVYANQLLVPPDEVFERPEWGPGDWKAKMMPHYDGS
jgi:cholesterol oxidase